MALERVRNAGATLSSEFDESSIGRIKVSDEKWSLDLISLLLFTLNNIYTRRTESQGAKILILSVFYLSNIDSSIERKK